MPCHPARRGSRHPFRSHLRGNFAIAYSFVHTADAEAVERAIRPNTKLIFVETPANPTMHLTNIAAIANAAHSHEGVLVAVDNTFLTPVLQNCLDLGADISMLARISRCYRPRNTSTATTRPSADRWQRIPPDLVRVSVGAEDIDDLIESMK